MNQYAWIKIIQSDEDLQGNLLFRELVFNWFYSLASLLPLPDHNPSYPGVGRPPPQRPGLQDNEKLGVAWVIYRIIMIPLENYDSSDLEVLWIAHRKRSAKIITSLQY